MSQNFLRDSQAIQRFIGALPLKDGHLCVEAGAGDGALTVRLARHFGAVTAWELDPAMTQRLAHRVQHAPGIQVRTGDFLASPPPGRDFHLAGNLPFGITTQIVRWALAAPTLISATVITQLEFARKHTGDYGRWTLTTVRSWPSFSWTLAGRIARTSFTPIPAVDAGIVRIQRRTQRLIPASVLSRWQDLVGIGFEGAGGSLFASLRAVYPRRPLTAAFRAADVAPDQVVAFVHPRQWVVIVRQLEGLPELLG